MGVDVLSLNARSHNLLKYTFLIKVENGGSISLNVPFAVDFFKALADRSETSFFEDKGGESSSILARPHLGLLMNLVDAKICPGPLKFGTIRPSNPDFASEFEKMNSKVKAKNKFVEDDIEITTMTLGNFPVCDESNSTLIPGESDGHGVTARQSKGTSRSFLFAVPHRQRR